MGPQHATLTSQSCVRQGAALVKSLKQTRQICQVIVPRKIERLFTHTFNTFSSIIDLKYKDYILIYILFIIFSQ